MADRYARVWVRRQKVCGFSYQSDRTPRSLSGGWVMIRLPYELQERTWIKQLGIANGISPIIKQYKTRETHPVYWVTQKSKCGKFYKLQASLATKKEVNRYVKSFLNSEIWEFYLKDLEPLYFVCDLKETWDDLWELEA